MAKANAVGVSGEPGAQQAARAIEQAVQFLENEQCDEAVDCLTRAIQLCPTLANAYFARAVAYDARGDFERAIADCTESIRLCPDRPRPYRLRGQIYEKKIGRAHV